MEINEALRRVFQLHWRLIAVLVIAVTAAAGGYAVTAAHTYTSSTRLVLDSPDPQSVAQATANADTVRAIATSADQIQAALKAAGVQRDPIKLAKKDISVQAIGSSGVVKLSVTDKNATVAADLANALTAQVIQTRQNIDRGQAAEALPLLDQRIASVDQRIATVNADLQALTARIAQTKPAAAAAELQQTKVEEQGVLDLLQAQRGDLSSQRSTLAASGTAGPVASVIQDATPPIKRDPSHLPQLIGLGVLLGLALGVGASALTETVRPTLIGAQSVGASLGLIPLGALGKRRRQRQKQIALVAERLLVAADAAGVRNIALVSADPDANVSPFAAQLESELRAVRMRSPARGKSRDAVMSVRPLEPGTSAFTGAIVVLSPNIVRKQALDDVAAFVELTKKTTLGFITYRSLPKPPSHLARVRHENFKSVVVTDEPKVELHPEPAEAPVREVFTMPSGPEIEPRNALGRGALE